MFLHIYFRVCGYLEEALDILKENDTILLGEGYHPVNHFSELEEGSSVVGIGNANNTILHLPNSESNISSLFDCFGTEVCLT